MRMDLLAERYRRSPAQERQIFVDRSAALLEDKRQRAARSLQAHREAECAQLASCAVAEQAGLAQPVPEDSKGSRPAGEQVRAGQDEASVLGLSLPAPVRLPTFDTDAAGALDADDPAPPDHEWPRIWEWIERPSGVKHSLRAEVQCLGAGSHGCCLVVQDTFTGEVVLLESVSAYEPGSV